MKSNIASAVQEQVFEFEHLIADLKQQKTSVSACSSDLKSNLFDNFIVRAHEDH